MLVLAIVYSFPLKLTKWDRPFIFVKKTPITTFYNSNQHFHLSFLRFTLPLNMIILWKCSPIWFPNTYQDGNNNNHYLHMEGHFTHETKSMWPLLFKHSHFWKRRSESNFASHYAWGTDGVCTMQDGCKVYMNSYMALNGSCSVITWTILKHRLLEVGLTQSRETMALRMLTNVGLFYFIMYEDPRE